MPGLMNDAGYCVTAAVDTTAISSSPANTTHITAHLPFSSMGTNAIQSRLSHCL